MRAFLQSPLGSARSRFILPSKSPSKFEKAGARRAPRSRAAGPLLLLSTHRCRGRRSGRRSMDFVDAPLRASPPAHVALVGSDARVVGALAFAVARRAAARHAAAAVLVVGPRRAAPPVAVAREGDRAPAALGGHGDGADLDRVALKYAETCADAAWVLNNVQAWPAAAGPRPTLLVVDGAAALVATGAPSLDADAPLGRLAVLAKLAASAADWLGCACVLACADGAPAVRTVLRRHFPHVRVVDECGVRDHADPVPRARLRDDGTHLRVRPA